MKRILIIILVLIASIVIGILAILTAIKLTTEKPVAPSAPEIKPRAEEIPPPACTVEFSLNPTPSGNPSITPSITPSATPTPTGGITPSQPPNVPPVCTGLSASPTSGDAPLVVTFVATGYDDNSGYLAGFEFNFGDGESKKVEQTFKSTDTYTVNHTYSNVGTYIASVRVKDNNGDWSSIPDACKQTIKIGTATISPTVPVGAPETPIPTTQVAAPQIPQAGNILPPLLLTLGGIILLVVGSLAL
ncbi:PKD domain-containing protein [Candidatus Gottesmanbacteria bacterium]|nr:PKD domain-containing protein [Candidatus Gottesmanbacteria bacterium]